MTTELRDVVYRVKLKPGEDFLGPKDGSRIVATGEVVTERMFLQLVIPADVPFPETPLAQWTVVEGMRALLYDIVERVFPDGMALVHKADSLRELLERAGMPTEDIEAAVQGTMKHMTKLDDLIRKVMNDEETEGEGEGEGETHTQEGDFPFTLLSPEEAAAEGRIRQEGITSRPLSEEEAKPQGEAGQKGEAY